MGLTGAPFLIASSDQGHAFGVVLSHGELAAYVQLQNGLRIHVPLAVVAAGRILLGKFAEEVKCSS